jgi:hypothetical protein
MSTAIQDSTDGAAEDAAAGAPVTIEEKPDQTGAGGGQRQRMHPMGNGPVEPQCPPAVVGTSA